MTEAEWLASAEPGRMLWYLKAITSDRKLRLVGCACVRRVWHLNHDERLERILLGLEGYADGLITAGELKPLNELAWLIGEDEQPSSPSRLIAVDLANASTVEQPGYVYSGPSHHSHGRSSAAATGFGIEGLDEFRRVRDVERARQTVLLRDIFGNPFRPVTFSPEWRTDTAVALAKQMYESRDFSAMPILADALQDAGCDSDDILDHCRGDGPHVRGCWIVDLVLGKE